MEVYKLSFPKIYDHKIGCGIVDTLPDELNLEEGDIIVHKGIPHYVLVSFLKVERPNIEIQPIMPGTEPFVQVGTDSSYISKKY